MAHPAYIDNGGMSGTSATTVSVFFPGTVNANDFLYLVVSKDVSTDTDISSHPSGFTFVTNTRVGAGGFCCVLYYKRAVGDEDGPGASVSLTWAEAPVSWTAGVMYRVNKVDISTTPPVDFGFGSASGSVPVTNPNIDGGTTTGSQRLLINAMMVQNNLAVGEIDPASGWTEGSILSGNISSYFQYQQVPSATTISDAAGSFDTASHYVSNTFALRPGPGWPHNFLGVDNADIGDIGGVNISEVAAVNTIS